jgi:hypothetical protein
LIGVALRPTEALPAPMDHRPANFFSAVLEKDKEVCEAVLASLNKEHRLSSDLYGVQNPISSPTSC